MQPRRVDANPAAKEERMPPFRTILVAADFSESSRDAFQVACALARAEKTRLLIVNVVEPLYVAEEPVYRGQLNVPFSIAERDPGYYKHITERLRQFYVPDHSVDAEYRTLDGTPAEEILRAPCDLIVMGTHGRTGLDRLISGSVAETVLRRASCPVLALRSRDCEPTSQEEAPATTSIRTILHPTDFSDCADDALRVARSLAREHGAQLIILHTIPMESVPIELALPPVDRRACQTALEVRAARLNGPELDLPAKTKLADGDAAEEIIRTADEAECDLIVMGTHGRSGLGRLLMGSVAESVLRRASRPVLAVKPIQALGSQAHVEACADSVKE
jgi:nucleotide-binding universal stress UspA family protein